MESVKLYYQKEMDGKKAFYSKTSKTGRPLQHLLVKKLILTLERGKACLDIGCNTGTALSLIKDRFDELYGVDIIDTPNISRKPYIRFKCVDLNNEPLPFPDGKFDLIVSSMILEHVFGPFHLMSEIARCLKKNGHFILGVPNACYFKHIISLLSGRTPRTAVKVRSFSDAQIWDGGHLHLFSIKDVKDMLEKYGFRIKSIDTSGKFSRIRRIYPSLLFSDIYILAEKAKT